MKKVWHLLIFVVNCSLIFCLLNSRKVSGSDNLMNSKKKLSVKEAYSPGYTKNLVNSYSQRKAYKEANFLIPYLKKNACILDCGCGPGNITLDLAKIVSEGKVIGIDVEQSQIKEATKRAKRQVINNVKFYQSSVYKLPFKDETFDIVFCHTLLQHLKEPIDVLKDIYRVLKPGGLVALRDDDSSSLILSPETPEMNKVLEIMKKIMIHSGGNPCVGKSYKQILSQAGFKDLKITVSCDCDSELEDTKTRGEIAKELLTTFKKDAIKLGWVTDNEMEKLIEEAEKWGSNPYAFDAIIWCEGIGFKK